MARRNRLNRWAQTDGAADWCGGYRTLEKVLSIAHSSLHIVSQENLTPQFPTQAIRNAQFVMDNAFFSRSSDKPSPLLLPLPFHFFLKI